MFCLVHFLVKTSFHKFSWSHFGILRYCRWLIVLMPYHECRQRIPGIILIHILAPQFYLFQRGSNISRGGLPPHHCSCTLRATPEVLLSPPRLLFSFWLRSPLHFALWALAPAFDGGTSIHLSTSLPALLHLSFRAPCHLGQPPIGIICQSPPYTAGLFHSIPTISSLSTAFPVALFDHHLGNCGLPAI